jgi:hypothetical protein
VPKIGFRIYSQFGYYPAPSSRPASGPVLHRGRDLSDGLLSLAGAPLDGWSCRCLRLASSRSRVRTPRRTHEAGFSRSRDPRRHRTGLRMGRGPAILRRCRSLTDPKILHLVTALILCTLSEKNKKTQTSEVASPRASSMRASRALSSSVAVPSSTIFFSLSTRQSQVTTFGMTNVFFCFLLLSDSSLKQFCKHWLFTDY